RRSGIDTVVSLLTTDEVADLGLADEAACCHEHGIEFVSFPIPDRGVPASPRQMSELVGRIAGKLAEGRNVGVHCRQGIGRSALLIACVLIAGGSTPEAAFERIAAARGLPVPDTDEQRRWVFDHTAAVHAPLAP